MNNILELFALPIGLKQVGKVMGVSLYGSKTLNDKYIQAISLSRRTHDISQTISKMVNNKMIIPCFADPGILSYFRRKLSRNTSGGLVKLLQKIFFATEPQPLDFILAFYHFEQNKIYVLISNHVDPNEIFTVDVPNDIISVTLTHELLHMYSHNQPNKFISLFQDELTTYYSTYFTKIFRLNNNKKKDLVVEQYYKYLFFEVEMKVLNIKSLPTSNIMKILQKFQKYSTLNKNEFEKVLFDYLQLSKLLFHTHDLLQIIDVLKKNYMYIIKPLYTSYRLSFGNVPDKGCTQEAYYPSEVICGYSDIKFNSKVKSVIKSIV